jgi:hypothetical protein
MVEPVLDRRVIFLCGCPIIVARDNDAPLLAPIRKARPEDGAPLAAICIKMT